MSNAAFANLNLKDYGDKALGCWTGKNIGGTLGAPFEGRRDMQDVSFYTQDLHGKPAPNDDLDLQLVWLQAIENCALKTLNERVLADYWTSYVTAPWNEYGVCKSNIRAGLMPPLSGVCNNDKWKNSNGAWIRAEIWACLFPGNPDMAAKHARMDACVDHCGDGIYAEMFVAALEAAAFVESDLEKLIQIGLSKIPGDCRVARSVKFAVDCFKSGVEFKAARERIVEDSKDLGTFQAPGNVAFVVLGLLYSEGDFSKAVCLAVNCGDDTDCTGATAGSVMGIIKGRSGIPVKWIEPIGEGIQTVAIISIGSCVQVPQTLRELTNRVASAAVAAQVCNADSEILRLSDAPTSVPQDFLAKLDKSDAVASLWTLSPYELTNDIHGMRFSIDYEGGPSVVEGEPKKLLLTARHSLAPDAVLRLDWRLPEGWTMSPAPQQRLYAFRDLYLSMSVTIMPGKIESAMVYVPLEIRIGEGACPTTLNVPFQCRGASSHWERYKWSDECFERMRLERARKLVEVV